MEVGLLFYSLTFLGGFLSFFSPCVIPIIPIYFSFLAGNGKKSDCQGNHDRFLKNKKYNADRFV